MHRTRSLTADELDGLRQNVAEFVDREVRPIIEEYEAKQRFPLPLMRRMGELGYFGALYPESVGGSGLGKLAQCVIVEELARGSGGVATTCLVQVLSLWPIYAHGTPAAQERYLLPGIRGEKAGAIAITEPDHGSDVAGIETVAIRDGDGYRLHGSKMFITNSPFADFLVVAAKTEPGRRYDGITLFIVDRHAEGLEVGPHLDKLGWWSSETAPVYLNGVWVPEENVIGEVNRGFYYIMEDFNTERLLLAAQSVGLAEEAFRIALEYARQRHQFGKPIAEFQAIRHKLARMATLIAAGRQLLTWAAMVADRGDGDGRLEASMAKYFCGEMVNRVAYDAIGVLGGAGYLRRYPVERIYRDARVLSIGGGTTEIQLNIIAKQLLDKRG